MSHLSVGQHQIFHQRHGAGEPLLLIQGMSGTHLSWGDPFLAALGDDLDIVSYDHRGIGRSTPERDPFSIVDLAEDAAGVLDALGLESAHVLGISMGGMIAQELALRHPERVRTLALGCTYCGGPQARLAGPEVVQKLSAGMMSGDKELAIRSAYEVNVSAGFAADPDNYAAFYAMATSLPAPVPVIMLQMQAIAEHDTASRLPGLDVPTLVVHGDEDQMLPVENGRLIASLVPDAQLEILDGVGHMFWWEHPARSAQLVREHALAAARAD